MHVWQQHSIACPRRSRQAAFGTPRICFWGTSPDPPIGAQRLHTICSADGIIHESCPSASGEKPAATLQPSHAICCIFCRELKCLEACQPSFRIWLRLHLVAKHAAGTGRPASVWRTSVKVLPLTPIVFEQMETTSG